MVFRDELACSLAMATLDLRLPLDVDKICALLGYYAASIGNPLPTFRDNVSVPSSRIKKSKKKGLLHP